MSIDIDNMISILITTVMHCKYDNIIYIIYMRFCTKSNASKLNIMYCPLKFSDFTLENDIRIECIRN